MIEVLKQAAEDVSKAYDVLAFAHTERALELLAKTRTSLRQAIREHAMYEVQRLGQEIEQEPVAWMHIMDNTEGIKANGAGIVSITQKHKHPFGKAGIDFSKSYPVTSTPLYTHPPQRTEQEPVAWMKPDVLCDRACMYLCTKGFTQFPECATAPPQRTWVGLTDDERLEAAEIDGADEWFWKVCKAIEAKLKDKNT
jgi:hypothetical protein